MSHTLAIFDDAIVLGDGEQITMAVHNLIENAINYSPENTKVSVTTEIEDGIVQISVTDQGIGIPESDQARIFERFYRTDPNGVQPGLGLGLSIVRGVVESSGGSVYVEDAPGGGAAFRVVLHTPVDDRREEAHVN